MTMYLALSVFTDSPDSLLAATKVSVFSFSVRTLPPNIQVYSKRWTQFRMSIFPELYTVCEWSTLHLKDEVQNFQITPLERSPSTQPCNSVSWEKNGYYEAQIFCVHRQPLCSNWWFQRRMLFLVVGWMLKRRRNARCTAVADSVLMNSRTQKILCCIVVILFSTDSAARLCDRRALWRWYLKI